MTEETPDTGPFKAEEKPKRAWRKRYRVITNTLFTADGKCRKGAVVKLSKSEAEAALQHNLIEVVHD